MAIPFLETGRTQTEHWYYRHKINEKEMISPVVSLNSKENFSWSLLKNLSNPDTFPFGI